MVTTTSKNDHRRVRIRPPAHPGGIFKRHYLEPLGIEVTRTALALGVARKTLSKILNERGAVTPEMALRLSRAFRTTPELWLNLQRNYDLWQVAHRSERWRQVSAIEALP